MRDRPLRRRPSTPLVTVLVQAGPFASARWHSVRRRTCPNLATKAWVVLGRFRSESAAPDAPTAGTSFTTLLLGFCRHRTCINWGALLQLPSCVKFPSAIPARRGKRVRHLPRPALHSDHGTPPILASLNDLRRFRQRGVTEQGHVPGQARENESIKWPPLLAPPHSACDTM